MTAVRYGASLFMHIYLYVYVCVHFVSHFIKVCNELHMYSAAHRTTDVDNQRGDSETLDGSETSSHKETNTRQWSKESEKGWWGCRTVGTQEVYLLLLRTSSWAPSVTALLACLLLAFRNTHITKPKSANLWIKIALFLEDKTLYLIHKLWSRRACTCVHSDTIMQGFSANLHQVKR